METHPVAVVVRYQAQPGLEDRAKRELTELVAVVVSEHACLGIDLHQDADDPTRFLLYERWADQAVYLGAHMQTPHLEAFIHRAREFLAGPPEITLWRLLESPGSVTRETRSPRPAA